MLHQILQGGFGTMHKNIKNALAKTHRENVWIFCKIDCGIFVKARPGEICPGGEKGEYLAATNDELFVKISTTKLPARAARELFRNKT